MWRRSPKTAGRISFREKPWGAAAFRSAPGLHRDAPRCGHKLVVEVAYRPGPPAQDRRLAPPGCRGPPGPRTRLISRHHVFERHEMFGSSSATSIVRAHGVPPCRRPEGQAEGEACAASGTRFQPHCAPEVIDDLPADRKPEAGPAGPRQRYRHPAELLEDAGPLPGRHPGPLSRTSTTMPSPSQRRATSTLPPSRDELGRIGQQVDHDLASAGPHRPGRAERRRRTTAPPGCRARGRARRSSPRHSPPGRACRRQRCSTRRGPTSILAMSSTWLTSCSAARSRSRRS